MRNGLKRDGINMTERFEASFAPTPADIDTIARATPHTPFNTPAYAAACASVGRTPCVFALYVARSGAPRPAGDFGRVVSA